MNDLWNVSRSVTRFGPDLDTPVASSVLLSVEALDSGVAPSGVKDLWGLLKRIEQTDIERERSSLVDSVALPLEQGGGAVDAAIRAEGGAAENLQVSIRGFQAISLGSWIKLPYLEQRLLPLIFDGLPSGIYAFRTMVRASRNQTPAKHGMPRHADLRRHNVLQAIDWAGNIGPQASPVLFKVDSSLPVPVFDEDSLGNLEAPQGSALSDALPTIKVWTEWCKTG